jgi:hypothetical protein
MRSVVFLSLLGLLLAATPGTGTCGPLLNEIMADPARDWDGDGTYSYRNDEWVEIVNPGPGTLDLAGYFLADEVGGRLVSLDVLGLHVINVREQVVGNALSALQPRLAGVAYGVACGGDAGRFDAALGRVAVVALCHLCPPLIGGPVSVHAPNIHIE